MSKLLTATFFILLISCTNKELRQDFPAINQSDIKQIVEAVLGQDRVPFHNLSDTSTIPLSTNLRKIVVTTQDTMPDIPSPIRRNTVAAYKLLNSLVKQERFFEWKDTSYFYFQNKLADTFKLDKTITKKIATTNFSTQNKRIEGSSVTRYYDLTIPILSKDQTRAYIELTNNCVDCGGATAFYLEKIKGKWTVVAWDRLWMN